MPPPPPPGLVVVGGAVVAGGAVGGGAVVDGVGVAGGAPAEGATERGAGAGNAGVEGGVPPATVVACGVVTFGVAAAAAAGGAVVAVTGVGGAVVAELLARVVVGAGELVPEAVHAPRRSPPATRIGSDRSGCLMGSPSDSGQDACCPGCATHLRLPVRRPNRSTASTVGGCVPESPSGRVSRPSGHPHGSSLGGTMRAATRRRGRFAISPWPGSRHSWHSPRGTALRRVPVRRCNRRRRSSPGRSAATGSAGRIRVGAGRRTHRWDDGPGSTDRAASVPGRQARSRMISRERRTT